MKKNIFKLSLSIAMIIYMNFGLADNNPFRDGYHQDTNPFGDGYIQNDNPFADGYIQDSNPFAEGYVQDTNPYGEGYIQDTNPFREGYVQDKGIFEGLRSDGPCADRLLTCQYLGHGDWGFEISRF